MIQQKLSSDDNSRRDVMTIQEHVGQRIRMYRKKRNLSMEQLAYMIDKTTSTISKYEKGQISIDIASLNAIAHALEVSIEQLVDYKSGDIRTSATAKGFFSMYDTYYMYQYFTPMKRIIKNMIQIIPDEFAGASRVNLYYDIHDYNDTSTANFIYKGDITYSDSFVTIKVQNLLDIKDDVFFYVKSPQWIRNSTTGFMLSYSQTLGMPSLAKVVFSSTPLDDNETLRKALDINAKDIRDMMKKTNYVLLMDNWEVML